MVGRRVPAFRSVSLNCADSSPNQEPAPRKWRAGCWPGINCKCPFSGLFKESLCHHDFDNSASPCFSSPLSSASFPSLVFPNFMVCHRVRKQGGAKLRHLPYFV